MAVVVAMLPWLLDGAIVSSETPVEGTYTVAKYVFQLLSEPYFPVFSLSAELPIVAPNLLINVALGESVFIGLSGRDPAGRQVRTFLVYVGHSTLGQFSNHYWLCSCSLKVLSLHFLGSANCIKLLKLSVNSSTLNVSIEMTLLLTIVLNS